MFLTEFAQRGFRNVYVILIRSFRTPGNYLETIRDSRLRPDFLSDFNGVT